MSLLPRLRVVRVEFLRRAFRIGWAPSSPSLKGEKEWGKGEGGKRGRKEKEGGRKGGWEGREREGGRGAWTVVSVQLVREEIIELHWADWGKC